MTAVKAKWAGKTVRRNDPHHHSSVCIPSLLRAILSPRACTRTDYAPTASLPPRRWGFRDPQSTLDEKLAALKAKKAALQQGTSSPRGRSRLPFSPPLPHIHVPIHPTPHTHTSQRGTCLFPRLLARSPSLPSRGCAPSPNQAVRGMRRSSAALNRLLRLSAHSPSTPCLAQSSSNATARPGRRRTRWSRA